MRSGRVPSRTCSPAPSCHALRPARPLPRACSSSIRRRPAAVASTAAAQDGVSLTVYNQNFAVVREVRPLALRRGVNLVRFEDVAAQIDPTSLALKALSDPTAVLVLEQNYQYNLIGQTTSSTRPSASACASGRRAGRRRGDHRRRAAEPAEPRHHHATRRRTRARQPEGHDRTRRAARGARSRGRRCCGGCRRRAPGRTRSRRATSPTASSGRRITSPIMDEAEDGRGPHRLGHAQQPERHDLPRRRTPTHGGRRAPRAADRRT